MIAVPARAQPGSGTPAAASSGPAGPVSVKSPLTVGNATGDKVWSEDMADRIIPDPV